MPDEPEARGLLALMLLQHSRRARPGRRGGRPGHARGAGPASGTGAEIAEAQRAARRRAAPPPRRPVPAPGRDRGLPRRRRRRRRHRLGRRSPRSTTLLRESAVAGGASSTGRSRSPWPTGPRPGLALVDELEASGALAGYHLLPATRADLLRRLGRPADAAVAYRQALELAGTDAERRFLTKRLAEVVARSARPERGRRRRTRSATASGQTAPAGPATIEQTSN